MEILKKYWWALAIGVYVLFFNKKPRRKRRSTRRRMTMRRRPMRRMRRSRRMRRY